MDFQIREARSADLDQVRSLFRDYERTVDAAPCFEGFEQELLALPGEYAAPGGALLVATTEGRLVGCVTLRPLAEVGEGVCEMKRLYVVPHGQGQGLGRRLVERIVARGRELGYRRLRLDTLPTMPEAIALYRDMGFREVERYNDCPAEDTLFFELDLG